MRVKKEGREWKNNYPESVAPDSPLPLSSWLFTYFLLWPSLSLSRSFPIHCDWVLFLLCLPIDEHKKWPHIHVLYFLLSFLRTFFLSNTDSKERADVSWKPIKELSFSEGRVENVLHCIVTMILYLWGTAFSKALSDQQGDNNVNTVPVSSHFYTIIRSHSQV